MWGIIPQEHKTLVVWRFSELGKSIFFVMETKKGGIFR